VTVSNDSGNVSVTVPDTWRQVAGSQFTDSSGITWDALTVSPDLQAFAGTYNVPGVALQANQSLLGTDTAQALQAFTAGAQADCTPGNSGPYDDGFYVGEFAYFTNCAGTTTDYAVVVADDYNQTHFIVATIQMVTDVDKTTVLDNILNSFQAVY
jgi:serine protease Do